MVKANTSHGLDRKFKPWRKGKSEHAKKGTLKAQLRGQQRLLPRATDETHRAAIQAKIDNLQSLIAQKHQVDTERQHAKKSHGTRFLERQKLTRLEKQARSTASNLLPIALDMVYVAHYPMEFKYLPLFRQGQRVTDRGRHLKRRAKTRHSILQALPSTPHAHWIAADLYDLLPSTWSIEQEEAMFGKAEERPATEITDARFATDTSKLEAAAAEMESKLEKAAAALEKEESETQKQPDDNDDSDGSSSNSSEDEADPLTEPKKETKPASDDSSDSSDSSDEEDDVPVPKDTTVEKESASSSSSSDDSSTSSSSSDSSDDDEQPTKEEAAPFDDDGFLVAAPAEDAYEAFSKAKRHEHSLDVRGDKSKGWATQRQRPGQFKKRKVRR